MLHSEEHEEELEEEPEEEDFIDEDCDEGGEGERRLRGAGPMGRTVTLPMLLAAGLLSPAPNSMSIEYLGQKFMGDLLPDGKIKSVETDMTFASPSAWAISCMRIVNPAKKPGGCGWASIKYKGKGLDAFKNRFFKLKFENENNKENEESEEDFIEPVKPPKPVPPVIRTTVKHSVLGTRSSAHYLNTLVESTPFSSLGKIQPFLVSMGTNAALVMDFHCHLTTSEVVGYLAGHWDVNAHNLAITHTFPCRSRLCDRELGPMVEADINRAMEQRRLSLVGWYHSHPTAPATPTLRDIDAQLDCEIRMKGNSDASYTPCVGVICSPYYKESNSLESSVVSYWVVPPPENKPHEYGKPMLMSYSVVQDQYLAQDALNEMKKCAEFYRNDGDFIKFSKIYRENVTYLEKLKSTLSSKFPRDQSDGVLWNFLSELVSPGSTGETQPPPTTHLPPIPASLPITIPAAPAKTSLLGAELASALFASGKFPSPASLMGLSALFPSPSHAHKPLSAPTLPKLQRIAPDDTFTQPLDKNCTITSGQTA